VTYDTVGGLPGAKTAGAGRPGSVNAVLQRRSNPRTRSDGRGLDDSGLDIGARSLFHRHWQIVARFSFVNLMMGTT
jgi:hypothetical protein